MNATSSPLTSEEFRETLTGFDEIFIEKAWGSPWLVLARTNEPTYVRALISVVFKRDGDGDPKHSALALTLGQVQEFFASASAAGEDGDAVGEAG